jgi:hypothetical protein
VQTMTSRTASLEYVQNLAESTKDEGVRQRAVLLRAYLQSIEAGEMNVRNLIMACALVKVKTCIGRGITTH